MVERSQYVEKVVLKSHNLPEQLRISANDIPRQEVPLISDLFIQTYMEDLLPTKILKAIRQGDRMKDITVAECTEKESQV